MVGIGRPDRDAELGQGQRAATVSQVLEQAEHAIDGLDTVADIKTSAAWIQIPNHGTCRSVPRARVVRILRPISRIEDNMP